MRKHDKDQSYCRIYRKWYHPLHCEGGPEVQLVRSRTQVTEAYKLAAETSKNPLAYDKTSVLTTEISLSVFKDGVEVSTVNINNVRLSS